MAESEFKMRDDSAEMASEQQQLAIDASSAADASNNDASADLHFFEGVEKLLEIWFEPSKNADMRKVPRSMWDALLKSVRCEIISYTRNDEVDAYVLSESSMFVSKRRWILKTCGTTTPLQCLSPLLKMAAQIGGYTAGVQELFYSRKNFKRPEMQQSPHRGFGEEVALLDSFFDDGRAYCMGSVNRDCWYIYTMSRVAGGGGGIAGNNEASGINGRVAANRHQELALLQAQSVDGSDEDGEVSCHSNDSGCGGSGFASLIDVSLSPSSAVAVADPVPEPDQTIEILMTELDPAVMALFTKRECVDAKAATERSGIHKLLPGMLIDDYLFEPCGYSMNGVGKDNGCYMTIHITPEPEYSYVSFESNVAASSYGDLIARVIETFQPNKFVVTVFANKTSAAFSSARELDYAAAIGPWTRKDIQFCRFASYDLTYAHYCKFPS